jgi:hypothetical protein
LIQIKSHAQKVLKRDELGDNVFLPLKANKEKIDSLLNDRSRLFQQESAPTLMSSDGRYHTIPLQQQQHHHQQQHQKITVAAATKSDHSPQQPHGQQPAPICTLIQNSPVLTAHTGNDRCLTLALRHLLHE